MVFLKTFFEKGETYDKKHEHFPSRPSVKGFLGNIAKALV